MQRVGQGRRRAHRLWEARLLAQQDLQRVGQGTHIAVGGAADGTAGLAAASQAKALQALQVLMAAGLAEALRPQSQKCCRL